MRKYLLSAVVLLPGLFFASVANAAVSVFDLGGWSTPDAVTLQSNNHDDDSTSCSQVIVSWVPNFSFDYAISSEAGYDKLMIYLDDSFQMETSGEIPWTPLTLSNDSGTHTVKFCYSKDYSSSIGYDTASIRYAASDTVAPVANIDAVTTPFWASTDVNVLANDTDNSGVQPGLLGSIFDQQHGVFSVVGWVVHFVPESGFSGLATATYRITDAAGNIATGIISITVSMPAGGSASTVPITWTDPTILAGQNHWYQAPSNPISYSAGNTTYCPNDGDDAGGNPAEYPNGTAVTDSATSKIPSPIYNTFSLNSENTVAIGVPSSGSMYCLQWDPVAPAPPPILTINASTSGGSCGTDGAGIFCKDGDISLTYNWSTTTDTGGSWVSKYGIGLEKADGTWVEYSDDGGAVPSTSNSLAPGTLAEGLYRTYVVAIDVAGNESGKKYGPDIMIDTTPPVLPNDILTSTLTPADNSKFLAKNTSRHFYIEVWNAGGSPISMVDGCFEDFGTSNTCDSTILEGGTLPYPSRNYALDFQGTMQDVDNDGSPNDGEREYSFKITKACDLAGNCSSVGWAEKEFKYYVYANTNLSIPTKNVILNELTGINIADGSVKKITVELKDPYGNRIIPVPAINRTVAMTFDAANTLRLDQYNPSSTEKAVFIKSPSSSSSYTNANTTFSALESTTGQYPFDFKVYTPTKNVYSKADGNYTLNAILVDVNGDVVGGESSTQLNAPVSNSSVALRYNPLYYTNINGDLRASNGFIEWVTQESRIEVQKNGTNDISAISSTAILAQFWGDGIGNFTLNSSIGASTIAKNPLLTTLFSSIPSGLQSWNTKLIQDDNTPVSSSAKPYLSTHISFMANVPGVGNKTIRYNSDIIGKNNYFDANATSTVQVNVKIVGLTSSKNQQGLTTDQMTNDVSILGNTDKFLSKTEIIKSAYTFSKATHAISSRVISQTTLNTDGATLDNGKILYITPNASGNVELFDGSGPIAVSGKKTILVIGGNVYIRSNMYYQNASNDMLGIIVLKDNAGNGGNIYIDPDVTNVVGTLFAEKSVMSYKSGVGVYGGNATVQSLKNQLSIYGSIFSENTIGGSRRSPLKCPYYVDAACTQIEAQKYDLNYLRRYNLTGSGVPFDGGKVSGGGRFNSDTSYAGGGDSNLHHNITDIADPYITYPIIIEYNPSVQSNPPPLFSLK